MIITAKFASTCPVCRRAISVGAKVEWSKGAKAICVECHGRALLRAESIGCAAKPVAVSLGSVSPRQILAAVGPARSPRLRRTGCACGSVEGEVRASDCWQCKHDGE